MPDDETKNSINAVLAEDFVTAVREGGVSFEDSHGNSLKNKKLHCEGEEEARELTEPEDYLVQNNIGWTIAAAHDEQGKELSTDITEVIQNVIGETDLGDLESPLQSHCEKDTGKTQRTI